MNRRRFLALAGAASLQVGLAVRGYGRSLASSSLLSAPIELQGDWSSAPPEAVTRVLVRARAVSLSGLRLLSDRQPDKLRVDNHRQGPPAIWLHSDQPEMASIIVNIGPADWCKLAYQFGHELGHVFCNSWDRFAKPQPPTQWLEEAMVEAFSIRGLGLLATSWENNPPFAGNGGFAVAIRQYRANLVETYRIIPPDAEANAASWFRMHRRDLESGRGVPHGLAVLGVLTMLESDQSCVEDLGAVNRWPTRSGIPIEDYLARWATSCAEVGSPGLLPTQLKNLFDVA